MSDLDLDAIRERAEEATAGPWHVEYLGEHGYPQRVANDAAVVVAETFAGPVDCCAHAPDAEFIAAARTDVPRLVAEVERLRRLLGAESFPTSDGYEAMAQALTDMRGLVVEMARHFPNVGSPDPRDTVRSDWVPAVSVARWKRIAAEVPR